MSESWCLQAACVGRSPSAEVMCQLARKEGTRRVHVAAIDRRRTLKLVEPEPRRLHEAATRTSTAAATRKKKWPNHFALLGSCCYRRVTSHSYWYPSRYPVARPGSLSHLLGLGFRRLSFIRHYSYCYYTYSPIGLVSNPSSWHAPCPVCLT